MTCSLFTRSAILLTAFFLAACERKQPPPSPFPVGSVVLSLPGSVHVPAPQGTTAGPALSQAKCSYAIDKEARLLGDLAPEAHLIEQEGKTPAVVECIARWTPEQYDCVVAAKTAQELVACRRLQRP